MLVYEVSRNFKQKEYENKQKTKYIGHSLNLPRLASYVCMYSDVVNCDTNAVLPVPASPNNTTRYLWIWDGIMEHTDIRTKMDCLWLKATIQKPL